MNESNVTQIPEWFLPYLSKDSRNWVWKDNILQLVENNWLVKETSHSFYESVGGVEQGRLAADPAHASYYDRPRYSNLVGKTVSLGSPPVGLALDFGCGDGRGTRMLLESVVPHIIALDFHLPSLQRLVRRLTPAERDRVVPVWAPVTMDPFAGICCDMAICLEVFMNLPDPRYGLSIVKKWLKQGGVMLVIEPAVESSLIYSLINGDLTTLELILKLHRRNDNVGDRSLEVHLHTRETLAEFMLSEGFKVLKEQGIPAGAALTIFSLKKRGALILPTELGLIDLANRLVDFAPRMHAIIVQMTPNS